MWIGYEHVLLPKLTYTFSTSCHLPKDLIKLQQTAKRATLLKLGFRRNIPTSTIYGVIKFGGLNFKCLLIKQRIAQITMAMRQIRAQTDIGNLCLIALSWWQLFIGVSMPLWESPQIRIKQIKHDWFASVRTFLATINGSLHIPSVNKNIQELLRFNDTAIMDHISNSKKSTQEQERINRVRLWLGVHSIAEITTADGKCITREAWEGTRKRFTRTLWPYQPKPGPLSFRAWQRFLADKFLKGHCPLVNAKKRNLDLEIPLTEWRRNVRWLQKKWTS